jgi:hypothetical protein
MLDSHTEEDVRKGVVEEFGNWEVHRIVCESLGIHEAVGGTNATIGGLGSFKLIDEEDEKPDLMSTQTAVYTTTVTEEGLIIVPSTPTQSSVQFAQPTSTEPPTPPADGDEEDDDTDDDTDEKSPEDMNPWEYLKWKAEKIKDQLDKWWEGVWAGDD